MKKNHILTITLLASLFTLNLNAQTGLIKKTIATLSPGETLANGENCFLLDKNPESVSFVTVVGSGSSRQYYCYAKDGSKTGPVSKPDASYWNDCQDIEMEDCIANDEPMPVNMEEYIDFGTNSVKFHGNSYGPFMQMLIFHLSDDEQNFYAVAVTNELKIILLDNSNRKAELESMPEQVLISPDGKKAFALVKGSLNPFDPESMQKVMSNPEEYNNPKVSLVGIDGTRFGPFTSDSFSDAWFSSSGQLIIYNNSEISLDGKTLFGSEDFISKCDIWISNNGKDYAWADYEYLSFNDGSKYTAPLVIKYVETSGKGYLKWIALESGKDLVFYSRPF